MINRTSFIKIKYGRLFGVCKLKLSPCYKLYHLSIYSQVLQNASRGKTIDAWKVSNGMLH